MTSIADLIQSSYRRDPSVQPITYSSSQIQTITGQLSRPTTLVRLPSTRTGAASSYVTQLIQSSYRRAPSSTTLSRGIEGTALRLPAGRSVISPAVGDRTGILPTSTLSTQSVFGGAQGGLGAATSPLGPATLTNFSSSVGKAGTSIMNTLATLIPLAIKVILAVIVIKIVLWLIKRRR